VTERRVGREKGRTGKMEKKRNEKMDREERGREERKQCDRAEINVDGKGEES